MKKHVLSIVFNFILAAAVLGAWLYMVFHAAGGLALTAAGFANLKYFTILSNLLAGAAAILYAISLLRGKTPRWIELLKYSGAVSVGLTFLVVMVFLGPLYGYGSMFRGANLLFHLLIPLAAMAEFAFFLPFRPMRFSESLLATVPMLLYGFGYLGNILLNGRGEWPNTNDWYRFTYWGMGVALLIFAVIILATWGIALLLRLANRQAR
ncbi:MAG: hypothetical protein IKS29_05780 [Oscillospiraceae bacterium]|nr:hypothetical protein [Oscillospiraceae bacterium]